jgi:hypothetical protein
MAELRPRVSCEDEVKEVSVRKQVAHAAALPQKQIEPLG